MEPKYVKFVFARKSPTGKTNIWDVVNKENQVLLGEISFWGGWHSYVFSPKVDMIFEKQCLRDIADFCEAQTKFQRSPVVNKESTHGDNKK